MALLFQEQKDGIQLGKSLDKCFVCEKNSRIKRETLFEGLLENKEIFILNINGLRHCLCMDHFKSLLGDYKLISSEEYDQLHSLLNQINNTKEESEESIEESIEDTKEDEKEKQSAKTTKAAKSSKGK